MVGLAIHI